MFVVRTKVSAGKIPLMEARPGFSPGPVLVVDFDQYPRDRMTLIRRCAELIDIHETADNAWAATGPVHSRTEFIAWAPSLWHALAQGRKSMNGRGFLVLKGTHVEQSEDGVAQLISLFISTAFGTPTRTDKKLQRFAWPVRYESTGYRSPTFSQTMAEAAFHTDSQYLDEPERYFGLFCVASDVQGKGTNFLVSRSRIVEKLNESHPAALQALKSPFPFRVPAVFTAGASDEDVEVVWAPIISEGLIRFRRDTIMAALALPGVAVGDNQLAAIHALEQAISEAPSLTHHLEPGEAIIVDNHLMLHARSPFSDSKRLLYRVRMKEQNSGTNTEQGGLADPGQKPWDIMEDLR